MSADEAVTRFIGAAAALVNDEAARVKVADPEGCALVEKHLAAGMVPRLVIDLGDPISVRCVLVNDLGDEVLQVFATRAMRAARN